MCPPYKRVNDTYGHKASDSAPGMVAAAMAGSTRASDAVGGVGMYLSKERGRDTISTEGDLPDAQ